MYAEPRTPVGTWECFGVLIVFVWFIKSMANSSSGVVFVRATTVTTALKY